MVGAFAIDEDAARTLPAPVASLFASAQALHERTHVQPALSAL